jgi:hypothetical protein
VAGAFRLASPLAPKPYEMACLKFNSARKRRSRVSRQQLHKYYNPLRPRVLTSIQAAIGEVRKNNRPLSQ